MTTTLRLADIDRIEKLSEENRELLRSRLKELDPTGEGERKRMESLELEHCAWNGKPKGGWQYESDYFSLTSNAPEEVVRRSAVRLEQIYAAYAHFLPPRHPGGAPTAILLYPSIEAYRGMLKEHALDLQNPAFFNPDSNRIVCGSDLLKLGDDLEATRTQHRNLRAALDKQEGAYRALFGKKPMELTRRMQEIIEARKAIANADKHNDSLFDCATQRLFAILYHESFHAYVSNFVYPPLAGERSSHRDPGELPRWLNEGLAQIFETAIVEAGELRVGHTDRERLKKVKEAVRNEELLPVKEVLHSGAKAFLVRHRGERLASDRAYLTSWALSAYLFFRPSASGRAALDSFIRHINRGCDPELEFSKMTGQKLEAFERDFHAWVLKLPMEGSMLETAKDR